MTRRGAAKRLASVVAIAAASVLFLAGCASDPLADSYRNGGQQRYVSGDGTIETYDVAERKAPVTFEGTSDAGVSVSSKDYLGQVLVVNFWYASCPPCRVEAPDLEALYQQYGGKGATFLGANVRDQADQARVFAEKFGITYPSVVDADTGNMLLAFAGNVQPNAVPTTLVIDRKGRVAARLLGQADKSTLGTLIRETIAESD